MKTTVELRAGKSGIALAAAAFGLDRAGTAYRILDRACTCDGAGDSNGGNVRRKIARSALRDAVQQLQLALDLVEQDIR